MRRRLRQGFFLALGVAGVVMTLHALDEIYAPLKTLAVGLLFVAVAIDEALDERAEARANKLLGR